MIVALLILLFGAGAVKGWIVGAFAWTTVLVLLLLAIGFVGNQYHHRQETLEHEELVEQAKPMILSDVAAKAGAPITSLLDVRVYDQMSEVYLCGSIAGTKGFGGINGRQRFLSNGGNTETERKGNAKQFDERERLHCTLDPDGAVWR